MKNVSYACPLCERRTDHGDYVSIDNHHDSKTSVGRTLHALVKHRVWMTGRTIEREFNRKGYGRLAQFNADVSRGLVPPKDYAIEMAEVQRRFDAEQRGGER